MSDCGGEGGGRHWLYTALFTITHCAPSPFSIWQSGHWTAGRCESVWRDKQCICPSVHAMNDQLQRSTRSSLATLCLHRNIHQGRRKGLLIQFVLCLLDHGPVWCYASTFKHLDRHGNIFVWSGPSVYYAGPYRGSKALATMQVSWFGTPPCLYLALLFTLPFHMDI